MVTTKKILVLALLIFTIANPCLNAQQHEQDFYRGSLNIANSGMYVLGSWALMNMVSGGIGQTINTGSAKYFHQMNLMWNTVNMGIAVSGLISNHRINVNELNTSEVFQKHKRLENILHINSGLDLL